MVGVEISGDPDDVKPERCECWVCLSNRGISLLHDAMGSALDTISGLESQFYYLRDVVTNVLEEEAAQSETDWFQQLVGAMSVTDQ